MGYMPCSSKELAYDAIANVENKPYDRKID